MEKKVPKLESRYHVVSSNGLGRRRGALCETFGLRLQLHQCGL